MNKLSKNIALLRLIDGQDFISQWNNKMLYNKTITK